MVTPYYDSGGITIYPRDARELVSQVGEAHAVITDPVCPNRPPGLLAGQEAPEALLRDTMASLSSHVKRVAIVMRSDSDPRFLAAVDRERSPFVCMQAMAYAVPVYLGRVLGGTEIAYGFGEPIKSRPGAKVIPMWGPKAQNRDDVRRNGHPCSRHITHARWLNGWWSDEGETILDPSSPRCRRAAGR